MGQPVRAGIEDVFKQNGIDLGQYHGGNIQGNGCRKIMAQSKVILDQFAAYIKILPAGQKRSNDDEVENLFSVYHHLFYHLHNIFSILRKKRYHVSIDDIQKAKMHRDEINTLWQCLKLSITPNCMYF